MLFRRLENLYDPDMRCIYDFYAVKEQKLWLRYQGRWMKKYVDVKVSKAERTHNAGLKYFRKSASDKWNFDQTTRKIVIPVNYNFLLFLTR